MDYAIPVTIVRAPGYPSHFRAKVIPGLGDIPAEDSQGRLAVIAFGPLDEVTVVPARCLVYGLDLVKRLEVDYDWQLRQWGVRHAFDGPFIRMFQDENSARAWLLRKL